MQSWVSALKVFQRPIGSDECKIFSALLLDTSAFESQKMNFHIAKGEQSPRHSSPFIDQYLFY